MSDGPSPRTLSCWSPGIVIGISIVEAAYLLSWRFLNGSVKRESRSANS
jgi:hypothetical protein